MKSLFTLFLFATGFIAFAQEPEQDVKSTIKQVSVFLEGAQVSRHAQVVIRPGTTLLSFRGISPGIQEQSIQVEAPSSIKILSVSLQVNHLQEIKRPEAITSLQTERRRLQDLIKQEQSMFEVYNEEIEILKANRSMGGAANGVEITELKTAMDYFRSRFSDIKSQQLQIEKSIRKYNEDLAKIDAQIAELKSLKEQPTGEVIVKVSSTNNLTADLKLKYFVGEARWFPSYDVRATNIKSPVSVTYKANVSQNTGEDWENVELTVSSANPSESGVRPVIKPWYLGFNNYTDTPIRMRGVASLYGSRSATMISGRVVGSDGEPIPGVNIVTKGTSVGTVTDAAGYYSTPAISPDQTLVFSFVGFSSQEVAVSNRAVVNVSLNPDVAQLQEVVTVGYGSYKRDSDDDYARAKKVIAATPVIRQTNVEFTMDEPFSIKSDGELRATEMVEYKLDALYEYYCVPKLETDAFLVAKVLGWDEYNFLEGEASLFFEGKYIGKSVIDTRNTSDTLTLSLGRDGNVLVTREKVKDVSSRQFIGSNQKAVYAYDIVIRNKKNQSITIVLQDQIPVPNTKEITVDKLEDSDAEYREDTGILKWKKEIASGKTETLKLKYAVRFPRYNQIILE